MTNISENYLTESQAAQYLGKCERTLIRWRVLKIGPPATRVGRRVMYRRAGLEAWLLRLEEEVA